MYLFHQEESYIIGTTSHIYLQYYVLLERYTDLDNTILYYQPNHLLYYFHKQRYLIYINNVGINNNIHH